MDVYTKKQKCIADKMCFNKEIDTLQLMPTYAKTVVTTMKHTKGSSFQGSLRSKAYAVYAAPIWSVGRLSEWRKGDQRVTYYSLFRVD